MERFDGARVTVMGLGRFGGAAGAIRWLAQRGASVLVTDMDPPEKLAESLASIDEFVRSGAVRLRLGGHDLADFTDADVLVVNPAVPKPWSNPYIQAALRANVRVTTEIELVIRRLRRERTVAITGSNGKSTTSAMIAEGLTASGVPALLGGNIGGSLLAQLDAAPPGAWFVLELSSFMLHWLSWARHRPGWSPRVAVCTNISPNHLDWHGEMNHYESSKRQILRDQHEGDVAILGSTCAPWETRPGVERHIVPGDARVPGLTLPGRHNEANAAVALAACDAVARFALRGHARDEAHAKAALAIKAFTGLPHRLQLVGEFSGVRFWNDSKSTTPDATRLAVEALGGGPGIHLIVGGYDKKIDLSPIAQLAPRLASLRTIGATGPAIAAAARAIAPNATIVESATIAQTLAALRASPGESVLLSPGTASWDQYDHYEKRGEDFIAHAKAWRPRA